MEWIVLQLVDSAFPSGGFAHSAGLEAAHAAGDVKSAADVDRFARAVVWQAAAGALPFLRDASRDFEAADRACDVFLIGNVTNRASRTQGRALAATAARVFAESAAIRQLAERASARAIAAHVAPVFGAVTAALGVSARDAQAMFLFAALRQVVSAAVRLGLVGPHEAQAIQHAASAELDAALAACATRAFASQTSPVLELTANLHDGLYARLFQS